MTGQNVRRAFIVFHVTLAIVIVIQSVMTLVHAVHSPMDSNLFTSSVHRASIKTTFR